MPTQTTTQLSIPSFFDAHRVGEVWRVPYGDRATQATAWAKQHEIQPAANDQTRVCLLLIDVQTPSAFLTLSYLSAVDRASVRWKTTCGCANSSTATWA